MALKRIIIDLENLSEAEQLKLWKNLWVFANEELPFEKILFMGVVQDKKPKQIKK
jgi:hypothetical protein